MDESNQICSPMKPKDAELALTQKNRFLLPHFSLDNKPLLPLLLFCCLVCSSYQKMRQTWIDISFHFRSLHISLQILWYHVNSSRPIWYLWVTSTESPVAALDCSVPNFTEFTWYNIESLLDITSRANYFSLNRTPATDSVACTAPLSDSVGIQRREIP